MADKSSAVAPPSRRQEHKQRTKLALQEAALELCAKNGFDETTTDQIAERAGVSPRTFFRYFPTKESVLLGGQYGWLQSFTKQLLDQPAELSDVEAIRETLVALSPGLKKRRKGLYLYEQAVASSATLRGGVYDHQQADIAQIAEAIAARRGLSAPDHACSVLATVALPVYRRAVTQWLKGPASTEIGTVIRDAFNTLLDELSATPAAPKRRKTTRAAGNGSG